jgi:predicted ATPase/DNA-binding winged helix-turn-helix (wHTH) protein
MRPSRFFGFTPGFLFPYCRRVYSAHDLAALHSATALVGAQVVYFFEGFALDTDRRELRRAGSIVVLQPKVFDLLEYLVASRDRVVSKDDLIQEVWSGRIVSDSALTTRINAARTAISDSGDEQRLIRTLPRKGFRFVGVVREGSSADEPASPVEQPPSAEATVFPSEKPIAAERRQLTVVSSELLLGAGASRMDPEDLRDVVQSYHDCVVDVARRYDGLVANVVGSTTPIYFGYPQAHEDDAERAVRAGLELIAGVVALKSAIPLQARVGIATGLVLVGDHTSSGGEPGIVGETPNLAARLQGIAQSNSVVIAESTRRLLGDLFELQDLGEKDLKSTSVRAWTALRAAAVESRFDALHASELAELVGREEEVEILLRRWSKAKIGEGRVVLISGEPGIGKSRLTAALLERIANEAHTRIRSFCSPQHTDSAFYPIIGQMERSAKLAHNDTPTAKLDKLDAMLAQSSTSAQDKALFSDLLSLPDDGRYPALELTPQQRRQRTLEVLVSQIVALSHRSPVLMIFEDAHWADPTSLELFARIVDKIPTLRVLLIVTFRPDFEPPWIGWHHVTALTLNRLGEREIGALIDRVTGNRALPESIRQDIIERTDGIPLFVEEMTKAVLEAESDGEAGKTAAAVPSAALAVPASLHASLMARLDRLGPAKEVAQIGAVIGREFPHALIAAVAHKADAELRSALDRLVLAGLLFRQGLLPQAKYLFKHALVQDAAYGALLREQRRALHARIAATLETQFAEIAETQPELLARHYTEAGLIEKAASLWGKAGQRSLARSALNEAVEQLSRAIAQLQSLPTNSTVRSEHIKLQVSLIPPLINIKGHAAPETREATQRARFLIEQSDALGEHPDDPLLLFTVLYSSWVANLVEFNGAACRDLAAHFLALAKKDGTAAPLIVGYRVAGHSLSYTGELRRARANYEKALALYDPAEHRRLATRFGQDLRAAILFQRSLTMWMLGYPNAAQSDVRQALTYAREIGQAGTLMVVLCITGVTHILCGSFSAAEAQSDEIIQLAKEKVSPIWQGFGMMNKGCALHLCDRNAEAIQMITAGMAVYRATRATVHLPLFLSHLALACARMGQFDEASKCIIEAATTVETTGERWFEAEANRAAGEIALKSPALDAAKAEAYFERALAIARSQQAKSWELRAAMSMTRLWRHQGKVQQARELLAPVYGWFTEGFDTRDLKEAKALLKELA